MFADDTSVSSHEKTVDLYSTMNGSLELLCRWFVANKFTLNVQKTKYILFHRKQVRVKFEGKLSFSSSEIDKSHWVTFPWCYDWRLFVVEASYYYYYRLNLTTVATTEVIQQWMHGIRKECFFLLLKSTATSFAFPSSYIFPDYKGHHALEASY